MRLSIILIAIIFASRGSAEGFFETIENAVESVMNIGEKGGSDITDLDTQDMSDDDSDFPVVAVVLPANLTASSDAENGSVLPLVDPTDFEKPGSPSEPEEKDTDSDDSEEVPNDITQNNNIVADAKLLPPSQSSDDDIDREDEDTGDGDKAAVTDSDDIDIKIVLPPSLDPTDNINTDSELEQRDTKDSDDVDIKIVLPPSLDPTDNINTDSEQRDTDDSDDVVADDITQNSNNSQASVNVSDVLPPNAEVDEEDADKVDAVVLPANLTGSTDDSIVLLTPVDPTDNINTDSEEPANPLEPEERDTEDVDDSETISVAQSADDVSKGGDTSSIFDAGKSIVSEIIDAIMGNSEVVSPKPNVVNDVDGEVNASISLQKCTTKCSDDLFSISTAPRILTIEEGVDVWLTCEAVYQDGTVMDVMAEMEWVFTSLSGELCSYGPTNNGEFCDPMANSFNSTQFVKEAAFVAELHLSNVSPSNSGNYNCLIRAPCCLPSNDSDIGTLTQEASSDLVVYLKPDHASNLMLAFSIILCICVTLCLSLFLYFRFCRKVHSNVEDLDKSGVKYKQMEIMTHPVIMVEDNTFCINEQEDDKY